jgi:uroporphyrinogen-III synthase
MKKILYLGTKVPSHFLPGEVIHYPVIRLIPKSLSDLSDLSQFSFVLFTSKNAARIFCELCSQSQITDLQGKCISIGPATTKALLEQGLSPCLEAKISTQEGLWDTLCQTVDLEGKFLLYPRSSLARKFLSTQLQKHKIACRIIDLYDVDFIEPFTFTSWEEIGEIVFTSPSTVEGFFRIFSHIPPQIKVTWQGPVTKEAFFKESVKKNR